MKIGIQTMGTKGDILPFLALAGGLSENGHDVTFVYSNNEDYTWFANENKFKAINIFRDFNYDKNKLISNNINNFFIKIANSKKVFNHLKIVLELFQKTEDDMYKVSKKLCTENDIVIGHSIMYTLSIASEKIGVPMVIVHLVPMGIESKFISPYYLINLSKIFNPLLWRLSDQYLKKKVLPIINRLMIKEGVIPIKSIYKDYYLSNSLTLLAFSPYLCLPQPDWENNIKVCGFFYSNSIDKEKWIMSNSLKKFINEGTPPVYITFGSSFSKFEDNILFLRAVKLCGQRAIIQTNCKNIPQILIDSDIYWINEQVPHQHIFPHCSVIVHHGGAGTVYSALVSGCPSVIVAHAFDQFYWGRILKKANVAPTPLHKRSITAFKLTRQINKVINTATFKINAEKFSKIFKKENGVEIAVKLIEKRYK